MAKPKPRGIAGDKIIYLPIADDIDYAALADDREAYQQYLDKQIAAHPELFPAEISEGYRFGISIMPRANVSSPSACGVSSHGSISEPCRVQLNGDCYACGPNRPTFSGPTTFPILSRYYSTVA